jgi:uncharacterized membrane protein (DUF106 family)
MGEFSDPVLLPILGFLLELPPFWAILFISLITTVITSVIYKYVTDQELLRSLKTEMKEIQKEMKLTRDNPARLMELQKKSMEKSLRQMKESFKPMLITMLPMLIIFGWISVHLAYLPVMPDTEFTTTVQFQSGINGSIGLHAPEGVEILGNAAQDITDAKAVWQLKGSEGSYYLDYTFDSRKYSREVVITQKRNYAEPLIFVNDAAVKSISVDNSPLKIFGIGWIWAYIIMSVVLNIAVRKLLRIH